ncbi:MAG: DUF4258 domain-containing protein [Bacteroidota bacterium]
MSFLKRLGYYLVGLSIGLLFLTFFLKKKSTETGLEFCYFPNCRTLKDLRSKPLVYSDKVNRLIEAREVDSLQIALFLNEGDVDFGKSDTQSVPCKTYFIRTKLRNRNAELQVQNCPEKAILMDVITLK